MQRRRTQIANAESRKRRSMCFWHSPPPPPPPNKRKYVGHDENNAPIYESLPRWIQQSHSQRVSKMWRPKHTSTQLYMCIYVEAYMMLRARVYPFFLINSRTVYENAMQWNALAMQYYKFYDCAARAFLKYGGWQRWHNLVNMIVFCQSLMYHRCSKVKEM